MRTRWIWMLLPLLLPAAVCEAQDAPVRQRRDVYGVPSGEAAMDSAMDRARATLPVFHGWLERAGDGRVEAKIKARFRQGDEVEHMWVAEVTFDGRVYRGRLESRPLGLTNVRPGDRVTITPERVSDWMVVVDGVMLGNFTTLELRSRMSAPERARLDRMMGYRILADTAIIALPREKQE